METVTDNQVFLDEKNQDKYGVRARQLELLEMYKELDKFLSDNGVRYTLCSGTLLGAIRHNGFIPWDDDIDIMMDRENYEKTIKLFEDKKDETRFVLNKILWIRRIQDKDDDSNSLKTPTIDIFVFDNVPDNAFLRKFKLFAIKLLQGMLKTDIDYAKFSVFYKICLFCTNVIGKLFTFNFKFKMYDRVARIGNKKDSEYLGSYYSTFNNLKHRYSKTLMKDIVYHQFEDMEAPIPVDFDGYLSKPYGDYMTPPKEEDRVSEHM